MPHTDFYLQPTYPITGQTISPNPPVSGTAYQNTNGVDILIYLPAYATTSGTAGNVIVDVSPDNFTTTYSIINEIINSGTSSSNKRTIPIRVPAGWYYKVTTTGTTLTTAVVMGY